MIHTVPPQATYHLINPSTKEVTAEFQGLMGELGIHSADPSMQAWDTLLQSCCFQRDPDFYKKGGINDKLQPSYQQACAFLERNSANLRATLPINTKGGSAILCTGVAATIAKRVFSLQASIGQGYVYDNVLIVAPDETEEKNALSAVRALALECPVLSQQVTIKKDRSAEMLAAVAKNPNLSHCYTLISDPTFAPRIQTMAEQIIGRASNGSAAVPFANYEIEASLYGYMEALGSKERAITAWAQSAANFKARDLHHEVQSILKQ